MHQGRHAVICSAPYPRKILQHKISRSIEKDNEKRRKCYQEEINETVLEIIPGGKKSPRCLAGFLRREQLELLRVQLRLLKASTSLASRPLQLARLLQNAQLCAKSVSTLVGGVFSRYSRKSYKRWKNSCRRNTSLQEELQAKSVAIACY